MKHAETKRVIMGLAMALIMIVPNIAEARGKKSCSWQHEVVEHDRVQKDGSTKTVKVRVSQLVCQWAPTTATIPNELADSNFSYGSWAAMSPVSCYREDECESFWGSLSPRERVYWESRTRSSIQKLLLNTAGFRHNKIGVYKLSDTELDKKATEMLEILRLHRRIDLLEGRRPRPSIKPKAEDNDGEVPRSLKPGEGEVSRRNIIRTMGTAATP